MIAEVGTSLERELNPWLAAETRFEEAAERLGLDDGMRKILRTPAKELTVSIPVQLDDGRLEVFTGFYNPCMDWRKLRLQYCQLIFRNL